MSTLKKMIVIFVGVIACSTGAFADFQCRIDQGKNTWVGTGSSLNAAKADTFLKCVAGAGRGFEYFCGDDPWNDGLANLTNCAGSVAQTGVFCFGVGANGIVYHSVQPDQNTAQQDVTNQIFSAGTFRNNDPIKCLPL